MGSGQERRERRRRADLRAYARYSGVETAKEWCMDKATRALRQMAKNIVFAPASLITRAANDVEAIAGPVEAASLLVALAAYGDMQRDRVKQKCHRLPGMAGKLPAIKQKKK